MTNSQVNEALEASFLYLEAFDSEFSYELIVNMLEFSQTDFNDRDDAGMELFVISYTAGMEAMGTECLRYYIYEHEQTKFVVTYTRNKSDDGYSYGLVYTTVYEGKSISIILKTLSGSLGSDDENLLAGIIDSIEFDTAASQASSKASVSSQKTSSKTSSAASSKAASSKAVSSASNTAVSSTYSSMSASSASSKPTATQPGESDGGNSVSAIIITLLIFAAPIIIYRYAIAKKPIESRKALMITIFYGLVGAAVTVFLAVFFDIGFACVGAVVVWSFVNYFILVKGKKQVVVATPDYSYQSDGSMIHIEQPQVWYGEGTAEPEQKAEEEKPKTVVITEAVKNPAEPVKEQVNLENAETPQFCYNCGAKLRLESKFCPKCGAKVEKLGDE
ncbi:MAG TPA: zinc ribbon domain-containing protein [Oscillospiraceae bacterium]|nr:zinc ribbon domain-containing protein [Oscillospiraceae bacterium]HPR74961.1 zinc ribbon domain-containing protein [Oscillospiraceae bacterium]